MPVTPPPTAPRLYRDANGHENFYGLIRSWINRSGWSFRAMAELAEHALREELAADLPDWVAGFVAQQGDHVVHDSCVWVALTSTSAKPSDDSRDWSRGPSFRRVHTSQLHKIAHASLQAVSADIFEALGTLNLYLANMRCKDAKPPGGPRLAKEAAAGFVLEDSDGPLGPEELFAIYLGRMRPPITIDVMSERQASELSRQIAKQLRTAAAAAGLDIIDDWAELAALHSSTDQARLRKLREIALGMGHWSAEQIQDEQFAVDALIQKLSQTKLGEVPAGAG
jgi:hypothetical protein